MKKTLMRYVGILWLLLGMSTVASAGTITFQFGTQFSNDVQPNGSPSWLTGLVDDSVGAGDLLLTLNTNGLSGSEFITGVYFSLKEPYDPLGLNVAQSGIDTTGGSFTGAQVGVNAFQADGDGRYDLLLNFSSNPPRFDADSTIQFLISHDSMNLALGDFATLAAPGGDNGPFFAAAHLQGIGANGALSTWIATSADPTLFTAVPDGGATSALLGMSMLAFACVRRKFSN
jgi:hypothetical protein